MKSALQIARAAYQPKLPVALRGALKAVEGAPTQSVADQEEVKKLFPNTYGMPMIKFETVEHQMQGQLHLLVFRQPGSFLKSAHLLHG